MNSKRTMKMILLEFMSLFSSISFIPNARKSLDGDFLRIYKHCYEILLVNWLLITDHFVARDGNDLYTKGKTLTNK